MLEFILGFIACYIALSFIHEYCWGQPFINIIELPALILGFILRIVFEIVFFIPIFLWKLFRNVNKPVKSEAIQNLKLKDDSVHVFGNIYFCHDKKAKSILNKFFFYAVIPEEIPSVPEGKFRIGS